MRIGLNRGRSISPRLSLNGRLSPGLPAKLDQNLIRCRSSGRKQKGSKVGLSLSNGLSRNRRNVTPNSVVSACLSRRNAVSDPSWIARNAVVT